MLPIPYTAILNVSTGRAGARCGWTKGVGCHAFMRTHAANQINPKFHTSQKSLPSQDHTISLKLESAATTFPRSLPYFVPTPKNVCGGVGNQGHTGMFARRGRLRHLFDPHPDFRKPRRRPFTRQGHFLELMNGKILSERAAVVRIAVMFSRL